MEQDQENIQYSVKTINILNSQNHSTSFQELIEFCHDYNPDILPQITGSYNKNSKGNLSLFHVRSLRSNLSKI